jgi:hydroxyethylthiazole kinase
LRTQTIHTLLTITSPTVIRGNASEILALSSNQQTTKGVDSTHDSKDVIGTAKQIAQENNCVVVISGAIDICVSPEQEIHIRNGHELMTKVTGMGCTATALIAAFCAVNPNALLAATHAMIVMGITGEIATKKSSGPGTIPQHFLDALFHLNEKTIQEHMRAEYA